MAKVKDCIVFTNGMVSSFDSKGEQISECQGFILDIADKLKECCDENTTWKFGNWEGGILDAKFSWYWKKRKEDICQTENML